MKQIRQEQQLKQKKEKFDDSIEEWKEEQMRKAFFGFLTAMFGTIVGMATMYPEIVGAGFAARAGAAGAEIAEIMASIEELITALADLEEMLDAISGIGDIDVHIPDLGSDIASTGVGLLKMRTI